MSEVFFMLLMPLFFVRLGVKWMLIAGMAAWVLRYVLFAIAAPSGAFGLIAAGILLHGICYDFFFVTGQIYVDKKSTAAVRGQAQGFLVLMTYGIGMLIGAQVAGAVYNAFLAGGASLTLAQWHDFWLIPAGFAAAVLVFFALAFHERAEERHGAGARSAGIAASGVALLLLAGCANGGADRDRGIPGGGDEVAPTMEAPAEAGAGQW